MEKFSALFEHGVEIELTGEDALSISHAGDCYEDVKELLQVPYVSDQLSKIDPVALFKELQSFGAWEDEDLSSHEENLIKILWLAGNDIRENCLDNPYKE